MKLTWAAVGWHALLLANHPSSPELARRAFLLLLVVSAISYTCLPLPVPWGLLILGCHTVLLGACMVGPVEQAEQGRTSVGRQGWVDQSMWQSRGAPGEQTKGPEGLLAAGCLPRCPCRVFLLPPRAGVSTLPPLSAFEAGRMADQFSFGNARPWRLSIFIYLF